MRVVRNDTVVVISGDDQGKTGRVLKIIPEKQRIIVEGVNFIKRHTRVTQTNQQGGIIQKEAPIHISNVLVYCPHCNQGARVGYQVLGNGKRARVCKNCGEMIPTTA